LQEEHCKKRKVWALSALDMDEIFPEEAYAMGEITREETENILK
jgi:hypothetical protein